MIDGNHLLFTRQGALPVLAGQVLAQTDPYDHCTMTSADTAPAELADRFVALLLALSYDDRQVRPLLDREGLPVLSRHQPSALRTPTRFSARRHTGAGAQTLN